MNALLDPQIADRLAKLCGIFGSHHAGERAAAAAKADELVRSHRLTWFDLLLPQPIVVKPKKAAKWRKPRTTKAKLAALREFADRLPWRAERMGARIRHQREPLCRQPFRKAGASR